jgi:macrodomain Ter protein organizer (MatP/YcbG family)
MMKILSNNQTKILDDILYQGLRPWSEKNSVDEKFAPKFRTLKEASTDYPFRYEIKFERPFDHKTKYYSKLILNTLKTDVERLYNLISEDDTENLIRYWLDDTLNKRLKTRLKDIGKLIKEKDFDLIFIDPKKVSIEFDQAHKANTYIIQLLKLSYMQLYLEIQDAFSTWIDDKLVIEDFYTQLLLEPIPQKPLLTEIQIIEVEATEKPVKKPEPKPTVNSLHSFTYKQLSTNPDKLTDLCDSLKKNNLISKETTVPNFKRVFTNSEIKTPIIWTGKVSELYYFIKLIHNELELVEYLKQDQWKITCQCFVDANGNQFDWQKFRSMKRPNSTGHLVEKVVEHLK